MDSIFFGDSLPFWHPGVLAFGALLAGFCLWALFGRGLLRRRQGRTRDTNWAKRPSHDIAQHGDVLGQLRDRLPTAGASEREGEPTIVDLLSQIVDVNATLHTRLESAEGTLENQKAEITAYKSEARTDPMTGLANRRVFDEVLGQRVANWQRNHIAVSVVLVDIDHFKRFNDDYGHLAGDEVLTQVAHLLREAMGADDLVSRIGGEEFAVVIDAEGFEDARSRAEGARKAIEQAEFVYDNQQLHVTVSVGGADSRSSENPSALVKRADVALYASKAAGRNQLHWHDGVQPIPFPVRRAKVSPLSGFATTAQAALEETKDFGTVCQELRQRLVAVAAEEV